jgi:hypothetical protein
MGMRSVTTGKDATEDFEQTGHSEEARRKYEEFVIGKLPEACAPRTRVSHNHRAEPPKKRRFGSALLRCLRFPTLRLTSL